MAPVEQDAMMDAAAFFVQFAELTGENPPHAKDYRVQARLKRIGLVPGKPFDAAKLTPQAKAAFDTAPALGFAHIKGYIKNADQVVNGWSMVMNPVGTYGTDYLNRALIA
jgi:hypothetical protein